MSSSYYNDLVKEINLVRKNPAKYAEKILGYKKYFKGTTLKLPTGGIQTEEGFAAFEEAAKHLKTSTSIEGMIPSKALGRIANDYLDKIKNSDPDSIGDIEIDSIIKKYGSFSGNFNNVMDFGSTSPELVIINLLVCDGDSSRCNRDFIINPEFKKVGLASGNHATYGVLTILISCTNFKNTFDPDDNETYGGLFKVEEKPPEPAKKEEKLESKTFAPKVIEEETPKKVSNDNINTEDPNVLSCERRERFVIERGKKKKKIVFIKKYKDGKVKKEVKYILL